MLTWIALLPGVFSTIIAVLRSPERAFLSVYIPTLLLLPQIYSFEVYPFPAITFSQAAIIPITVICVFTHLLRWKVSLTDFGVLLYISGCTYSEVISSSSGQALKLLADMLSNIGAPYALGKVLIVPQGNTVPLARRMVFLLFIIVILCAYEMRMTLNPFVYIPGLFFPGQGTSWPTLYRNGWVRIGGPFVQPILFGIAIAVMILLNYWLQKNKLIAANFKFLPKIFFEKGTIITLVLLFGLYMTQSRAPIISCFLGYLLIGVGVSNQRMTSFLIRFIALAVILLVLWELWGAYTQINQWSARSEEEFNAAYRGEILRKYWDVVMQKPFWGWGFSLWPKFGGMKSIDNHYLWLALKHGLIPVCILLGTTAWVMMRLLIRGLRTPSSNKEDSSLAFAFLSIFLTMVISLYTVYMGMQIEPLYFLFIGWAEAFILLPPQDFSNFRRKIRLKKRRN